MHAEIYQSQCLLLGVLGQPLLADLDAHAQAYTVDK